MDLATLIGIIGGIALIIIGIITGDDGVASLKNFGDFISVVITLGGTLTGLLTSNTIADYINGFKSFKLAIKSTKVNEGETIKKIIDLSNVARKEGLLALEEAAEDLEDQFMKKGVLLIVDGTDPDLVRAIMETELTCIETRHSKVIGFWNDMAAMGPAWGMIGTLIGLVNMLKNLEDASTIGPNMAVALLTTLYGSMLANWVATPVANKLKVNNNIEIMLKEVMIEGLLSIQAGENPRVIEEKLKSFLSPKQRDVLDDTSGGDE
ncbi:MAG: MotA/TolQ/ExbB proton channel family protein [Lachnospiraceae bacterium]|nr:MotA/TolQ/ExbB proton channel family protein [Lachnospiraceae bacterium]MDE6698011.1 MotA/TolQ/ExbB proton channel family protein [Lachnospiraceae bacterium]